jgi:cell surface protein SprA
VRIFPKYTFIVGTVITFFFWVFSLNAELPAFEYRSPFIEEKTAEIIPPLQEDTSKKVQLPYNFNDNSWDPFDTEHKSGLYLSDPKNITNTFEYDPATGSYNYSQKIGDINYRNPVYMTFEEYLRYDMEKRLKDNWKQRKEADNFNKAQAIIPKIYVGGEAFDRIFGGNTIDIRPQGTAELIFAIQSNKLENPAIPERQRRQTAFDFNQKIQLNVVGNIGEKLKISTNYNTEATFDFENQMKLEYTGYEDEIIKKIEAGNVNLPLTGSLITGSQSLFGIKTQLQFGRLWVTSVYSQQRGKKQEIEIAGGTQTSKFEISADNYEANKHFYLAHYFKDAYDNAMATLPIINSTVNITRLEVWITNVNTQAQQNTRNIVGFMDLGERNYFDQTGYVLPGIGTLPSNQVNGLYDKVKMNDSIRNFFNANSYLSQNTQLQFARDFDIIQGARMLSSSEYNFNPQLGFISLNQTLNPDQVLAVAFQYTIAGSSEVYQVGEFSTDGITGDKALILKLIKASNINTRIPLWELMMKNVYSLGAFNISRDNFRLQVTYNSLDQGIDINYIPEGDIKGIPLLQVLNLDRINMQTDAKPDGFFDFIEGKTINPQNGRIYFPVVEPFGNHLRRKITGGDINKELIANKYVFDPLYDTTKIAAQQRPDLNRFKIKGTYQSSNNSEISLNAMNIPPGSVVVTAGGAPLTENTDYTVDYTLGRVKIINPAYLQSNTPIKVSLESNAMFAIQQKSLFGTHFDYRVNKDLSFGATVMNLTERPLTQKVNMGDEPMSNTIWGLDGNWRTEAPYLTKLVDKLPYIQTKEMSTITVNGEFAQLLPGNSSAIGKTGTAYIDDFEGSQTTIDIRMQGAWSLASVPQKQPDLFPEGNLVNDLRYGYNRSKLAWYTIDPLFFRNNSLTPTHIQNSPEQSNHYTREVLETEIFPNRVPPTGQVLNMPVLDLAFYPKEKGPYNYDVENSTYSSGIDSSGLLRNPASRWGGIMRKIDQTDFQTSNIEYIQFWLMDPFHPDNGIDEPGLYKHTGGELYFNLGNISEDILRDNRKAFENGLPTDGSDANTEYTAWGRVSTLLSLVNAFDNNPSSRPLQDVGLDGLESSREIDFFDSTYLARIRQAYGPNSIAYQEALKDPSNDDFHYFRGADYDQQELGILQRYKKYNGLEGNSSTTENSPEPYPTAATTMPNVEDINRDNTLGIDENYFQYKMSLKPQDMLVGQNYIVDKTRGTGTLKNGKTIDVDWYQIRIPVTQPEKVVGGIEDFTTIRFIRMFMRGFSDSVVLRFARLEFVRSDWRKYVYDLRSAGEYITTDDINTSFDVSAVNFEENGEKIPVNYVIPPKIDRQIDIGTANLRRLNEQAMQLKVCNLEDGDARAAYKNINLDMLSYKNLKMYVHAEALNENTILRDKDVNVFVRLGRDFVDNYYEYELPLYVTPPGKYDSESEIDREKVWPEVNNIDIVFEELKRAKMLRNAAIDNGAAQLNRPFTVATSDGRANITIMGNPNIQNVVTVMVGVRNPKKQTTLDADDGLPKCAEVWVNEMRLTDFDKSSGWASTARTTAKLADFGTVTVSGNISTPGWGTIEKKISERQRSNNYQYDFSSNFELGKLLPPKANLRVPMFYSVSESFIDPQFNPNDPDIELYDQLASYGENNDKRDSLKKLVQDYTKRRSINFSNVKKEKGKNAGKPRIYDIENWAVSYSYNETFKRDVNTQHNTLKAYRGILNYNFNPQPKNIQPFEKVKWLKSKHLKLISDFNFYTGPNRMSFTTSVDKNFNEILFRNNSGDFFIIDPTFNKNFTVTRLYEFRYDLTKSLKFDFTATNNSRIFEPDGLIDSEEKKDTLMRNIKAGGINTNYNHALNVNYNVPINKIPILDWVTLNTRYSATYDWTRAPFAIDTLGHTIKNSNSKQVNGQANLVTLYNKIPYLKNINQKASGKKVAPKKPTPPTPPKNPADTLNAKKPKKEEKQKDPNKITPIEQVFRVMMMLKNASINYTENEGTILPGFNDSTKFLGFNDGFLAPTPEFVLGFQDANFAKNAAQNNWLVKTSSLNVPYARTYSQTMNMRANLEPAKSLKIELNASKNKATNNSEFFRWNDSIQDYLSETPISTGNYSISFITINTAFIADKNDTSTVFQNFLNNRLEVSSILGSNNPNSSQDTSAYFNGYGGTSQEVIIPAFLAAYTGRPVSAGLYSAMPAVPLPNWRITYDGLSKLNFFKKYFKTVTVSHAYRSSLNISSYTTNLLYKEDASGNPNALDINGNFISQYQIAQLSITEQFSPLANIDMTWNNSLITKVEYKKDRNLVYNFSDNRLSETRGFEWVVGTGYRFKDVILPFKVGPTGKAIKSDLNLRVDLSIRDNVTITRGVADNLNQPTGGQQMIAVKTAADYVINQRLNVRLFYDHNITNPKISNSFPSSNSSGGISLRFTLS